MMVTFGCQGSVKSVKFPGKKEENIEMLIHQHATTACEMLIHQHATNNCM
jgi:hypothetical protein